MYLSTHSEQDSLEHPACQPIKDAWQQYGGQIAKGTKLRTWLRLSFFKDVHLGMYENRPIYFPLSSTKKNLVALVSIHCWADDTLQTLLADYLVPELNQLQGQKGLRLGTPSSPLFPQASRREVPRRSIPCRCPPGFLEVPPSQGL